MKALVIAVFAAFTLVCAGCGSSVSQSSSSANGVDTANQETTDSSDTGSTGDGPSTCVDQEECDANCNFETIRGCKCTEKGWCLPICESHADCLAAAEMSLVDLSCNDGICDVAPMASFWWQSEADTPATLAFWDAFRAGRYEDIPKVMELLDAELAADPNQGWVMHIRWRISLWEIAEAERHPDFTGEGGGLAMYNLVMKSLSFLDAAWALNSHDDRYYCFHGAFVLRIGRGPDGALPDEALVQQGIEEVEIALKLVPEYADACRVLAYQNEPLGSETFSQAVEAILRMQGPLSEALQNGTITDISKLADNMSTSGKYIFPFLWEGKWLRAGDTLLKAGQLEAAKQFYENGKLYNYETWPLYPIFDDRINGLLERRALYEDDDPTNDPVIGYSARTCGMCHAK